MQRQFLHTGLIAQDTAFGALTAGVDSQHCQLASIFLQHVDAEYINGGTLACTRNTADAYANRVTCMRQTFLNHLLRHSLMIGQYTLYQCYRTAQNSYIALQDTFYIVVYRKLTSAGILLAIRVHYRHLLYSCIYLQAFIFFTVFRMFHHGIN